MRVPRHLPALMALYCVASFVHFAHNAEFLADYPNLPAWFSRGQVYLAWLAVTAVGALGVALLRAGWRRGGLAVVVAYALLGFAGLDHYAAAPMSAHTPAMNATIAFEVACAALLLAAALAALWRTRA